MWNYSMKKLDAVIVVEGKMDKDVISSFLDCDIITTNGSAVSRETINLIKELKKRKRVIVLTDPDAPGKRIRDILNNEIPRLENAFVPKNKAIKGHKVGVAECSKDTIMEALEHIISPTEETIGNDAQRISMSDLFELGLVGDEKSSMKRIAFCEKMHIGECNAKTLLKRCNMLGLSKDDIKGAMNG